MSANPFHIIRSNEEPPEALKQEVMGSVRTAVLIMRFAQLFLADYTQAIFEKLSLMERKRQNPPAEPNQPES
ncbi:MAG: hypothetical protein WAT74_12455 [Flavobacteriales bacterium]